MSRNSDYTLPTMPITETDLRAALEAGFPNGKVEIKDLAGDDDHWSTTVTDASFVGKSRIEQHRSVQAAVEAHDIHALQIKTQTE